MKAVRSLLIHRVAPNQFMVTGIEIEGERTYLNNTPNGLNTGIIASDAVREWEREGYRTNGKIQDVPGLQVLAFTKEHVTPTTQALAALGYQKPE